MENTEEVLVRPVDELRYRIKELEKLEKGWLSDFGSSSKLGSPVFPGLIKFLSENVKVLRASKPWVFLYPTPDGGVTIEWRLDRKSMTLEILPNFTGFFMVMDHKTCEISYHKNFSSVTKETLQEVLSYESDNGD